jgi:hypothetical protein
LHLAWGPLPVISIAARAAGIGESRRVSLLAFLQCRSLLLAHSGDDRR